MFVDFYVMLQLMMVLGELDRLCVCSSLYVRFIRIPLFAYCSKYIPLIELCCCNLADQSRVEICMAIWMRHRRL